MEIADILGFFSDTHKFIEVGGIFLIILVVYLETGFFLGLVLPGGDYLLFTVGIFCGSPYLDIPVLWVVVLLIAAAFLGDLTGYLKGRWIGPKLFTDNKSHFFKLEYLDKSKSFYEKFGMLAFILGRFMPVIRTLIPMLSGASGVKTSRFLLMNLFGSVIWIGSLVPLGYFIGKAYPGIINYSGYILVIIVIIASAPMIKILFFNNKKS